MLTYTYTKRLTDEERVRLRTNQQPFYVQIYDVDGDDGFVAELISSPSNYACGLYITTNLSHINAQMYSQALQNPRCVISTLTYTSTIPSILTTGVLHVLLHRPSQLKHITINAALFRDTELIPILGKTGVESLHLNNMLTIAQHKSLVIALPQMATLTELGLYDEATNMTELFATIINSRIEKLTMQNIAYVPPTFANVTHLTISDPHYPHEESVTAICNALRGSKVSDLTIHGYGEIISQSSINIVVSARKQLTRVCIKTVHPVTSRDTMQRNGVSIASLLAMCRDSRTVLDTLDLSDFVTAGTIFAIALESLFRSATSRLRHLHLKHDNTKDYAITNLIDRLSTPHANEHILRTVDLRCEKFTAFFEAEIKRLSVWRNIQSLAYATDDRPKGAINDNILQDLCIKYFRK